MLPSYDLKETFVNWFQESIKNGSVNKERVVLRYEENWTPEKPRGRSLYVCAAGYGKFEEDAHTSPFGAKDNRETMNNIPGKFIHYLTAAGYKGTDFRF